MISAERVVELHAQGIVAAGQQLSSDSRQGCIGEVIDYALMAACYIHEQEEPDPIQVAAYLLRGFIDHNCFIDGNKRVAWLAALEVLDVGAGLTLDAPEEDAAEMVLAVAQSDLEIEGIAVWMADHLVAA